MGLFTNEKKQKARASEELAVVVRATEILRDKRSKAARECLSISADITTLENKIKAYKSEGFSDDSDEILEILYSLETLDLRLETQRGLKENFNIVCQSIEELRVLTGVIFEKGWYKYLIRVIPEKKIGKLIKDEGEQDFEAITKLITGIYQKILDKYAKDISDAEEMKASIQHVKDVSAQTAREGRALMSKSRSDRVARACAAASDRAARVNPEDLAKLVSKEDGTDISRQNHV